MGLFEFGQELVSKSDIFSKKEEPPKESEIADIKENIEEFLNSMREFEKRCNDEIFNGIRRPEETATIEEWFQSIMLMTDADQDDPENANRVTLMTVHSAKGLEYKYVYIVGAEDGIFPSRQVMESPDALEEERRLFYVALTRAKVLATVSHVEMRYNFQSKKLDLSHSSRFISEIDPQYLESPVDVDDDLPRRRDEGGSAIDELRRRFDYRFQQKQQQQKQDGGPARGFGRSSGGYSGRYDERGYGSGPARRYPSRSGAGRPYGEDRKPTAKMGRSDSAGGSGRFGERSPKAIPDPALVQPLRTSTEGMRRLGVRPASEGAAPLSCNYSIGQRVAHPRFGPGVIVGIDTCGTDPKLVIRFDTAGEKTLLPRFANLTEL